MVDVLVEAVRINQVPIFVSVVLAMLYMRVTNSKDLTYQLLKLERCQEMFTDSITHVSVSIHQVYICICINGHVTDLMQIHQL